MSTAIVVVSEVARPFLGLILTETAHWPTFNPLIDVPETRQMFFEALATESEYTLFLGTLSPVAFSKQDFFTSFPFLVEQVGRAATTGAAGVLTTTGAAGVLTNTGAIQADELVDATALV